MTFLTPARIDTPELLDEHDAPAKDVDRSLCDLRRINRWLGGTFIYRRSIRRFAPLQSIVDVGAGSGDLLETVDVPLRIAFDLKIEHLRRARVHRVIGDAQQLPFRCNSVDVMTSAHFFHHFTPDENRHILRESLRVARKGVAVNDTRRNYVPLLFVRLLGALRLVGRITRFDAPASVLRGYTTAEVRQVAAASGAKRTIVRRAFPWRFIMLLWK